jgi:hypothetical protein
MKLLSGKLNVTSRGKDCPDYRAQVKRGKLGAILVVEQPFDNGARWSPVSSWYISTLMNGGLFDSIYIDYGQDWHITEGLRDVVMEALEFCADEHKEVKE